MAYSSLITHTSLEFLSHSISSLKFFSHSLHSSYCSSDF
nr:MAG TPA: hypothetical protein [Caudoviricetes sp.]